MKWDEANKAQQVLMLVEDSVGELFYYDRKEDDDLPVGSIEKLLKSGELTVDQMVAEFKKHVEAQVKF